VALVEADRVAAGVTGYTTAKLSVLHTLIYAKVRKSFGADAARRASTAPSCKARPSIPGNLRTSPPNRRRPEADGTARPATALAAVAGRS
jgi:hypothetical protein